MILRMVSACWIKRLQSMNIWKIVQRVHLEGFFILHSLLQYIHLFAEWSRLVAWINVRLYNLWFLYVYFHIWLLLFFCFGGWGSETFYSLVNQRFKLESHNLLDNWLHFGMNFRFFSAPLNIWRLIILFLLDPFLDTTGLELKSMPCLRLSNSCF